MENNKDESVIIEKIKREAENTIKNSPIVVCVCGHNKWVKSLIVKHVPTSISKSEYLEFPILCCNNCKLEIPHPSTLKLINKADKVKGEETNDQPTKTNESKDGPNPSSETN